MIIFGASISPFARKAVAFAREKGIDIEHRPVPPHADDEDFKAASPFGKIPGLIDGDYYLSDSTAIIHYIEAKHPEPALIPNEPQARGRVIWFDKFADTILVSGPAGTIFFNRVAAKFFGVEGDLAAAETAEKEGLPPVLDYLEAAISNRDWLVGDTLTLADIAVAGPFKNLEYARAAIDWDAYPKTKAYTERVLGRESFAELLAMDQAMVGG